MRRAAATTARSSSTVATAPCGFPGELTHTSFTSGRSAQSATSSVASISAPASRAPIAYVGYATRGSTTVSPAPRPSIAGKSPTSSFEPTVGSTPSGSTVAERRRANQSATAWRRAGVPYVRG